MCAYELGIPMELISVKSGDNLVNANSMTTGGSITSELVCQVSNTRYFIDDTIFNCFFFVN